MPRKVLKIVMLGDPTVGKTSLMNQYVCGRFGVQYKATIGADFLSKDAIVDERPVCLQIWDTAGQERFLSLGVSFYRGADACALVFDTTQMRTFAAAQRWRDEFLVQASPKDAENFPFILLGNKVDLIPNRQITSRKAQEWADHESIPYFEVSAKTGINVEEAFEDLMRRALERDFDKDDRFLFNQVAADLRQENEAAKSRSTCPCALL